MAIRALSQVKGEMSDGQVSAGEGYRLELQHAISRQGGRRQRRAHHNEHIATRTRIKQAFPHNFALRIKQRPARR